MEERCIFEDSAEQPATTQLRREAWISSSVYGFSRPIQVLPFISHAGSEAPTVLFDTAAFFTIVSILGDVFLNRVRSINPNVFSNLGEKVIGFVFNSRGSQIESKFHSFISRSKSAGESGSASVQTPK